jgi:hypothetical protein
LGTRAAGRPKRIENGEVSELLAILAKHGPTEVVVETSPAWPWLHDLLQGSGRRSA